MKKITIFTFVAIFAMAFVGCSSTNTANNSTVKVNGTNVNSNTAVVLDSNKAPITNTNTGTSGNSNRYNANMTREEYEKNQADYDADRAGSKIGTGANDKWLWFKTRAALLGTNDLRESTINVDVDNAVVTLRGTVGSKAEVDKAISVAKGIDGVKDVKSVLTVKAGDSLTNQMTGGASDGDKKANSNATAPKK